MVKIGNFLYPTFEEFKHRYNLPIKWKYSSTYNDFDTEDEFIDFNSWIDRFNNVEPIKAQ